MPNSKEENVIRVYENGGDGNKYQYSLDIRTEPATVIVTVCPESSVNIDRENNHGSDDNDESRNKRCQSGDESDSDAAKKRKFYHKPPSFMTRENKNLLIGPGDVDEEENERVHIEKERTSCKSGGTKKNSPQKTSAPSNSNKNSSAISSPAGTWTRDLKNFPVIPIFNGDPGLHLDREKEYSALSCFRLFFTDWLLKHLQEQTNKHVDNLRVANPDELDKDGGNGLKDWKPVSLTELKGFILILLHMGAVRKSGRDDHWSQEAFVTSPFAAQILSRGRFRSIMRMLHMNDNHTYIPVHLPGHDPLHKIRPVYDHLQERFQKVYTPNKNVALDGATYFDFSLHTVQHCDPQLVSKRDKSGLRLYKLSECQTGYVYNFKLCSSSPEPSSHNGVGHEMTEVALLLMKQLSHKGHHVYTDTKFTSPALYKALTDKNTMCTGTISGNNPGMPQELVAEELHKARQIAFRRKDQLCAVKWNQSNCEHIFMLTSAHHPLEMSSSNKTDNGKMSNYVIGARRRNPMCVYDYNKNMLSVVENNAQITEYMPLAQQQMKWPNRVFLYFLILSIKQAMIVYNKLQDEKDRSKKEPSFSAFVKAVGKQLAEEYIAEQSQPTQRQFVASLKQAPNPLLRTDHSHFHYLVKLPVDPSAPKIRRRSCKVCNDVLVRIKECSPVGTPMRNRRTVSHWCAVCKVPLCTEPCFYIFHNEGDYVSVGAAMDHYISMAPDAATVSSVDGDDDC